MRLVISATIRSTSNGMTVRTQKGRLARGRGAAMAPSSLLQAPIVCSVGQPSGAQLPRNLAFSPWRGVATRQEHHRYIEATADHCAIVS